MGCCKKGCCSPKVQAIVALGMAPINLAVLIWGIAEKMRWTPFYSPLQCEELPPDGIRLSDVSMPSPYAEGMGLPVGSEPYGLYMNQTVSQWCTNPTQSKITILADGFLAVELFPNVTDLAIGGVGRPYKEMAKVRLARDVVYPIQGRGEMVSHVETAFALPDLLAGMAPDATARGYSITYGRSSQTIRTCASVFLLETCVDTPSEQFCGYYGGNCMVPKKDSSGAVLDPEQLEPAICSYTARLCGEEAEVHAQLNATAMGIQVASQVPCDASLGLPNGTLCNIIEAPGVEPGTMKARVLETPLTFTTEAQARNDEAMAQAESAINIMIYVTIGLQAVLLVVNLVAGFYNLRKHLRSKDATATTGGAPPTLAAHSPEFKA